MKILLLFVFLPSISMAESTAPWPISTRIQNIISAVGPNWNSAGNFKALLIREGEYAALYIFRGPYDQAPLVYVPRAAMTGDFWATIPWLEIDESGALLIQSENHSHGRIKWNKSLTIIERNGQFIVSKYSRSFYDSHNPDVYGDCNMNVLSRSLTLNGGAPLPLPLPAIFPIEEWNEHAEALCDEASEN